MIKYRLICDEGTNLMRGSDAARHLKTSAMAAS